MQPSEKWIKWILFVVSCSSIFLLGGIFFFLLSTGVKAFSEISVSQFFTGILWNPEAYVGPQWGILSLLLGTVMVALGSLFFAVPLGLASAIYLAELAPPRWREILKPMIEMIAGIPSVVLGLIGLLFVSPLVAAVFGTSSGLSALTSSLIVGIMIIPTIISISEDVLSGLPKDFREASYALGATRWQTITKILLPAATSGMVAAVMLALGRAVGETMAVLMVAGNSIALPHSFLDPVRPITATIAIEIKEVVQGSLHYQALFAIGLILFMLAFAVNFISDLILERYARKYQW